MQSAIQPSCYDCVLRPDRLFCDLPADALELPPAEEVVEDWETLRLGPRVVVEGRAFLGSGVRLPRSSATTALACGWPRIPICGVTSRRTICRSGAISGCRE